MVGVCSSTRHSREKAAYSNYGPWISLCAPGWQFVRSPLQMGMASGTSFASPMVAGFLGQLLLDAPCATPRTGLNALARTADPVAGSGQELGAGILNPGAAEHYMQTLHACDTIDEPGQRLIAGLRRFGTSLATYAGLIIYFFVSVFAVPFLLAYTIERGQRRIARRQYEAVQMAYEGPSEHRRERLLALRRQFEQKGQGTAAGPLRVDGPAPSDVSIRGAVLVVRPPANGAGAGWAFPGSNAPVPTVRPGGAQS